MTTFNDDSDDHDVDNDDDDDDVDSRKSNIKDAVTMAVQTIPTTSATVQNQRMGPRTATSCLRFTDPVKIRFV